MAAENIEFLPYYEVKEIAGDGMVQKVILTQNQTGEEKKKLSYPVFSLLLAWSRRQHL